MTEQPSEFDLAAARLLRETKQARDEARATGREHLAYLLGKALLKVIDVWKKKVQEEDRSETGGGSGTGGEAC